MSQIWTLILGAALVSYLFRALPFILSRLVRPLPEAWIEALEIMSYAIIGGLVADSLAAAQPLGPRIAACLLAYVGSSYLGRPSVVFYVVFLGFYFVV